MRNSCWSKALGSFANGGGGVVIWGVRAERDATTGIDAVQEVVPVPDVHRLATKLKDLQPPATDPPIKGVVIQPLLLPDKGSSGFVVCLIPESEAKPHRSEWCKGEVERINMRIGDTTQECTVPILRQLFNPRIAVSAQLEITAEQLPINIGAMTFVKPGTNEMIARVSNGISVCVRNTGPSSIHEPVLDFDCGTVSVGTIEFNHGKNEHEFCWFKGSSHLTRMLHPRRAAETRFAVGFGEDQPHPQLIFTLYARDLLPLSAEMSYLEIVQRPWTRKIVPLLPSL